MNIVMISSEAYPWVKSGGLGDVCGAMPKHLVAAGHTVKLFVPWYKQISEKYSDKISTGPSERYYSLSVTTNFEVIFVKNNAFFWREGIYSSYKGEDYSDNLDRFSFFCERSLWLMKEMDFQADIIHCHDWQTAPAIIMLKTSLRQNPFFEKSKTIFTIHNIAYQGSFSGNDFWILEQRGINRCFYNMHELEHYGKINLMKGAIYFADFVYTVSPNYAKEVLTADFGEGMEYYLRNKGGAFCGVLNGIDLDVWNPKTDPNVPQKYDTGSFVLKKENKAIIQKKLGLAIDPNATLLALVGRLTRQKGIDVVAECISSLPSNCQLAILGDGEEKYKMLLTELRNGREKQFSLSIALDEKLARELYAGSDAFLLPSRFEPCGLTQMYSYRYGTLPVVFPVGGLVDTVKDYSVGGYGFVCGRTEMNSHGFTKKIEQALHIRQYDLRGWNARAIEAMSLNFGWEKSIKKVLSVYDYLITGDFPAKNQ